MYDPQEMIKFCVYPIPDVDPGQRRRPTYEVRTAKQVIEAPQAPRRVPNARKWRRHRCRRGGLGEISHPLESVVSYPNKVWGITPVASNFSGHFTCYFVLYVLTHRLYMSDNIYQTWYRKTMYCRCTSIKSGTTKADRNHFC